MSALDRHLEDDWASRPDPQALCYCGQIPRACICDDDYERG